MDDVRDDAKGGGYRRIEVLTGPGRRRIWSDDDKARIVSETLQPGAVVTEVARRWQVCPQQVFGWRRKMRLGMAGGATAPLDFVPSCRRLRRPHRNGCPRGSRLVLSSRSRWLALCCVSHRAPTRTC